MGSGFRLISRIAAANLWKLRHPSTWRRSAATTGIGKRARRRLSAAATAGSAWLGPNAAAATAKATESTIASAKSTALALPAGPTALALPARSASAWSLLPCDKHKLPLVVMIPPVVKTNRRRLALAHDANDAAHHTDRPARLG